MWSSELINQSIDRLLSTAHCILNVFASATGAFIFLHRFYYSEKLYEILHRYIVEYYGLRLALQLDFELDWQAPHLITVLPLRRQLASVNRSDVAK